jgi:hypothetical protein
MGAVIDTAGFGWGRYSSREEAQETADWMRWRGFACDVVRVK